MADFKIRYIWKYRNFMKSMVIKKCLHWKNTLIQVRDTIIQKSCDLKCSFELDYLL